MTTTDRPKLRPISAVLTVQNGARCVALVDPFGVVAEPVVLPVGGFEQVVRYFDGAHSLGRDPARGPPADRPVAEHGRADRAGRAARAADGPGRADLRRLPRRVPGRRHPPAGDGRPLVSGVGEGPAGRPRPLLPRPERRRASRRGRRPRRPAPGGHEPAHRLRPRRADLHPRLPGPRRAVRGRRLRDPRGRAPTLPATVRDDVQGLRDPPRPGTDRPDLRRAGRRDRRRIGLRRRDGAPERALGRVPGRLPPAPARRPSRLLDRADPRRLVRRPDAIRRRPDRRPGGPPLPRRL